jgi:hypothetical protein
MKFLLRFFGYDMALCENTFVAFVARFEESKKLFSATLDKQRKSARGGIE